MIQITNLSLMRGSKELLQDANATIYPGHKVGLVGANGCGKSSLFALFKGQLQPDQGECDLPRQWQIASVAQETPATDRSALDYVIDGDHRLRAIQAQLAEAEHAHDGERIAALHLQLEQAGGYQVESKAAIILAGLGFSQQQISLPVRTFSGGWRMRLNLAQALLCHSDLLLLDEPTNHLDLDAVIWLERFLQRYPGTLILISHDKAFLDAVVEEIIHVEQQTLNFYKGNYSAFEGLRAEKLRQQDLQFQKQQAQRAHLQSFIDRFKAKASKAKQAQSRVKQLEKMEQLAPAHYQSGFSFEFMPPPKLPNPLVSMDQVQVGYGDKIILQKLQLNLVPGSRIGLLGRNGAGKSTLIKLLAEENKPIQGQYVTSAGLQIGYFAQHQLEYLDPEASALTHVQRLDRLATEQSLRDFLGGFGFRGDEALSPVAPMSGGEKARLVLALLVYQKPNLLLLDEPTNHLDLDMRHALNMAIQAFEGALVLVSHDRFLLTSVCDEFYLVDSGQVQPFSGDLDDYKNWLSSTDPTKTEQAKPQEPKVDRKAVKRLEAEFRQRTQPLRKAIDAQEKRMDKLNSSLADIENQMLDTSLYEDQHKAKLKTLLEQQVTVKQELEELELSWLDNQEQLEGMQQEFEASVAD
ncbi:ATP-binding cassette domain-containing protein [Bowmanella sp. Y26]|uniref:ATP-binding cassette domain-containing protein n=1 Tax=Bowmanella yangjiangensis TaxID=2811230 RepID=UPI001BDD8AB4|nr:ATP-binding cassette domain-containing protein [Bowmanella yangjiangensis]MBT1065831.1 ATP-binding cassette domain-containing protein [Bowmanella yangjiangensis]